MIVLDSIIIGLLALILLYHSSYHPKPVFDLLLAVLPFLICWLAIGSLQNAFDLNLNFQSYLKRISLTWLVSAVLGQGIRFVLEIIVNRAYLTFLGLLIDLILFSILFLSWRVFIKFVFHISEKSGNANRTFTTFVTSISLLALLLSAPYLFARIRYEQSIFSIMDSPSLDTGLVFGAGVYGNQIPSTILRNRLETAADLYHQGKIQQIVLSGSATEVEVMLDISLGLQIEEDDLILDDQGTSTFESCSNVNQTDIEQPIILISQKYHLYRALFSCHSVGLNSYGVQASPNSSIFEYSLRRNLREIPATAWTFLKVVNSMVLSK